MSMKVKRLTPPSFVLLVRQLKRNMPTCDAFEIDVEGMVVKGDLAVIKKAFPKPLIGSVKSLDLAKRTAKSDWMFVRIPEDLEVDLEFSTLVKNKGVGVLRGEEMPPGFEYLPRVDPI